MPDKNCYKYDHKCSAAYLIINESAFTGSQVIFSTYEVF